jgi:hypothetical protein
VTHVELTLALASGGDGVLDMALLSVIRRWYSRDQLSIRILARQSNSCDPFVNKAGVLPCAYVGPMVGAAREGKILEVSTLQLKPFEEAGSSIIHQLELSRPSGLLPNHGGSRPNFGITNDIANPDFYQVAAAQLVIAGEIEEGPTPDASVLVEKEADRPNLTGFQRALPANLASNVPLYSLPSGGIKF